MLCSILYSTLSMLSAIQVYMGRPSPRLDGLATPVLAELSANASATRVGVHIRLGDVNLPASPGGPGGSINPQDRRYSTR